MDPLHFCIAIAPLAVYLLMLGIINLAGRPFVTTGARDTAALAIGICGLVIAGPMELFFPEAAASQFGPYVWLMLIVFYGLCVSLIVLLMRSRIVIYNITSEQIKPILKNVALRLDPGSRWVGDSLSMPAKQVFLHVESTDLLKNVQLTAGGNQQNFEGWREIELGLVDSLRAMRVRPNMLGVMFLIVSGVLSLGTAIWMVSDQQAVAQAFQEMLRR